LPLNESAMRVLDRMRANCLKANRIFVSAETRKPLNYPKHWFTKAVREAGIVDFHWHDLRHTFATRLRRNGVPLEDIADLLGHRGLAMTKRYAHTDMSRLRQAVRLLSTSEVKLTPGGIQLGQ
jgi:integrase